MKKKFAVKKEQGMTFEEAKEVIDKLKECGETEEDIVSIFFMMFQDDKLTLEELEEYIGLIGYELTDEFKRLSPEEQKSDDMWVSNDENDDNELLDDLDLDDLLMEMENDETLNDLFKDDENIEEWLEPIEQEKTDINEIVDTLRKSNDDEEIIQSLYLTFLQNVITLEMLRAFYNSMGYDFANSFLGLSEYDKRNSIIETNDESDEINIDINKIVKVLEHGTSISVFEKFTPSEKLSLSNEPKRYKNATYIKEMVNVGDYYVAKIVNEVMLVKVVEKGNKNNDKFALEIIDLETFYKQYIQIEENKVSPLLIGMQKNDSKIQKKVEEFKAAIGKKFQISNNFDRPSVIMSSLKKEKLNFDKNRVELKPEFGLFKRSLFDDKLLTIPGIVNTRDAMIGRQEISLFENYFYLKTDMSAFHFHYPHLSDYNHKYIVFRKVKNPNRLLEQLKVLDEELIVDAIDLKCALAEPFKLYKNANRIIIKNSKGNEYNFIDVFRYISAMVTASDRTTSKYSIVSCFSEYYQRGQIEKFIGFSSKEIKDFLEENYIFDVARGYYYSHDTSFVCGNDLVAFDRKWFGIFYNYIKKNLKKNFYKCSDIKPIKRLEEFFNFYLIDEDELPIFVGLVKESNDYFEFENRLVNYLINKYGYNETNVTVIHNHCDISEQLPNIEKKILQDETVKTKITNLRGYRRVGYFKTLLLFTNEYKNTLYALVDNNTQEYEIFSKEEFGKKYFVIPDDYFCNPAFVY